jgi:hypothetical protein
VIKAVEEKGINAGPGAIYAASKTHAEKAAWKFMEDNKGNLTFDLVAVLPSYVSKYQFDFPFITKLVT